MHRPLRFAGSLLPLASPTPPSPSRRHSLAPHPPQPPSAPAPPAAPSRARARRLSLRGPAATPPPAAPPAPPPATAASWRARAAASGKSRAPPAAAKTRSPAARATAPPLAPCPRRAVRVRDPKEGDTRGRRSTALCKQSRGSNPGQKYDALRQLCEVCLPLGGGSRQVSLGDGAQRRDVRRLPRRDLAH
eukprot:2675115-Prymnesium_polylepis.1